jgi:hypothetical protein
MPFSVIETFLTSFSFSFPMKKEKGKLSKIGMLVLLILIALGFTIPGFLNQGQEPGYENAEPRLCQTDADCYLLCDDPLPVLCSQNLCQQNACEEANYFSFEEEPVAFTLSVSITGNETELAANSNPQDIFVVVTDDQVRMYSQNLRLQQVLEKLDMSFAEQCFVVSGESFCTSTESELLVFVNGERTLEYGLYLPQEGDVIEITYV